MAVKVFRGDVSPDGQMVDEVDIACALDHPNLTLCASPPLSGSPDGVGSRDQFVCATSGSVMRHLSGAT